MFKNIIDYVENGTCPYCGAKLGEIVDSGVYACPCGFSMSYETVMNITACLSNGQDIEV